MDRIASYDVIRSLNTGEYAEILLCRDGDDQTVIKLFQINNPRLRYEAEEDNAVLDNNLRNRFEREILILGKLRSPNIIDILESGELLNGAPFYAMPYCPLGLRDLLFKRIDAHNVTAPLPRSRPSALAPDQSISILRQLLTALNVAHSEGIIHRDVKPANIRFDLNNTLKLCDFGFAKGPWQGGTPEGREFGHNPFMSPEQINTASIVDTRTDPR